jgi:hypothetical protein
MLLCRHHHRLVHEEGFGLKLLAGGRTEFRRPDGRLIPDAPPAGAEAPPPGARRSLAGTTRIGRSMRIPRTKRTYDEVHFPPRVHDPFGGREITRLSPLPDRH